MRPETLKRRLEVLRQRAADARPPQPVRVVIGEMGETREQIRQRFEMKPIDIAVCVVDFSVPRPTP